MINAIKSKLATVLYRSLMACFISTICNAGYFYAPQIYDLANTVYTGILPVVRGGTGTTTATGTGSTVLSLAPTLTGNTTVGTINKYTLTSPASGATLTIADGKTLTSSNTLTFTGTDSSSVAFGTGGTATYTANNLSVFASTTSSQLAGVLSDETGTGVSVFGTSPTITTTLKLNANTTAPTSGTGEMLNVRQVDAGTGPIAVFENFGTGTPGYYGRQAAGTSASPGAVVNTRILLELAAYGYDGSAYQNSGRIFWQATENWSGLVQGTKVIIQGNVTGTSGRATFLTLAENNATVSGNLISRHLVGATGTPTIVAGTGAGTSPTVSVNGNDTAMQVSVTTGTTPTGAGATIATITYIDAFSSTPHPLCTPANANAVTLSGIASVYADGASTTTFTIKSTTTGLTAATNYLWNCHTIN